ncbi:hypothetical protein [Algoriphagus sp. A40]|uniref:hypothetical protein n=1 Tax=Algoriphagus sp. A40 TaxID=1945863 RepID=UPI0009861BF7|nr:hypothetical protein [Algoriphagus sp. A40]OOG77108.1 hypothetical protein B0E43_05780 [Algoriphagus sp. A40]
MSKRISFGFIFANWIVGLFLILLLPTSAEAVTTLDDKSYLQTSKNLISETANLPESPSLEFDLKFFLSSGLFNSIFNKPYSGTLDFPVSKYNTIPFFDVKQTFIQFFYTW